MRIATYGGKLVEEIGYLEGQKVVFFRYLKDGDKEKCDCGRIIERDIDIVEGCKNWDSSVKIIGEKYEH